MIVAQLKVLLSLQNRAVLVFLSYLIHAIQPFLTPICFVFAWLFAILLLWSICSVIFDTILRAKQMHEIPCTGCCFFTNDYRLKCTVQPGIANTEKAVDCPDYSPQHGLTQKADDFF